MKQVHLRVEEIEHGAQVLQGDPEEQHSAPVAVDTSLHVRVTTGYHLPLDLCGRCHLPPEEDSLGREVHLSLGLGGEEQSSAVRGGQAGGLPPTNHRVCLNCRGFQGLTQDWLLPGPCFCMARDSYQGLGAP